MTTKQEAMNENDIFVKEIRQMQKIAKQVDDNWKITRVYDKFPPKPLDMDLLAYFQLKCDFLTAKENAFTWWTSNVMEVLEEKYKK